MNTGVRDELYAHARAEAPRECCGLIVRATYGHEDVLEVWPARNVAEGEHEFLLDPRDQYKMLHKIAAAGSRAFSLEAIYHSHPRGPAALSSTDRALAFYPVSLVVVSLEPEAICWFPPD